MSSPSTFFIMTSPMESLPVELFDMIAAHLSLSEHQTLRLTSRRLHHLVHTKFVWLAFSEQSTTLGPSSLDRLIKVSSHQGFREAVKILHIRLLNQEEYEILNTIKRVGRFPPPKRFPRTSGIKDKHIFDEATTFDYVMKNEHPTRLYDGLTRVLKNLPRLKSVSFSAKTSAPSVWELGAEADHVFRSRCFEAVTHAITHSRVKLDEFSMARRKRRRIFYKQADVSFVAFHLGPQLQALQLCFSNLQSLTLSIITGYGAPRPDGWTNRICGFIAAAPKLKNLTLSLDRIDRLSQYSCATVTCLAASCRLSYLEKFELVNCAAHGKDLIELIRAHSSSLRHIVVSNIRLVTSKWCLTLDAVKTCPQLKYLQLVALEDRWTRITTGRQYQDRVQLAWDVRKDNQNISDWLLAINDDNHYD